jgi:hypothetical protein
VLILKELALHEICAKNQLLAMVAHSKGLSLLLNVAIPRAEKETASQRNSQQFFWRDLGKLRHHRSMETRCAQCGVAMTCQPEGGCWCAELPHVPMPTDAEGCLCRNCLLAKIEALQNPGKTKEA